MRWWLGRHRRVLRLFAVPGTFASVLTSSRVGPCRTRLNSLVGVGPGYRACRSDDQQTLSGCYACPGSGMPRYDLFRV